MIFRIVDPDTGEILDREFLVEKEAIRNFKIKAKRLNAVIRQIGEKMFGFKTEEEKEILADYNNVVRDMKELKDLVDQMSATIATQAQMIGTRDQLLDEAYLKLESAETELIIRRKNDEFRQKLTVAK